MNLDRSRAAALLPDVFLSRRRHDGEFKAHVAPVGGCWLWLGSMTKGAPRITPFRGATLAVRHIVWLALRGGTPGPGDQISAACGRASCVAPDHLVMMVRGTDRRHLDDDTVRAIRNAGRTTPAGRVAEAFGITPLAANHILTGYSYFDGPWADGEVGPVWVDGRSMAVRRTPAPTRTQQPQGERVPRQREHS